MSIHSISTSVMPVPLGDVQHPERDQVSMRAPEEHHKGISATPAGKSAS